MVVTNIPGDVVYSGATMNLGNARQRRLHSHRQGFQYQRSQEPATIDVGCPALSLNVKFKFPY